MLTRAAIVFGAVNLALGAIGFTPVVVDEDGQLLGVLRVNAPHNMIHLLTGGLGILAGSWSRQAAHLYLHVFGVVLGLLGLLGLLFGDFQILGIANNMSTAFVHLALAAVALYLALGEVNERTATAR